MNWSLDNELPCPPGTLACPFCCQEDATGRVRLRRIAREGDSAYPWTYTLICCDCAAEGGWAKTISGAFRHWQHRGGPMPQGDAWCDLQDILIRDYVPLQEGER